MEKIVAIMGSFHKVEVETMLSEAKNVANQCNLEIVQEIWVPGSYEKPLALKRVLQDADIKGAVLLGIIEKGDTKHGLVMAQVMHQAAMQLSLEFMKPVGMGVLGPEIEPDQIEVRLKPYAGAAVKAVASMLN